jgi:hypothetical protein
MGVVYCRMKPSISKCFFQGVSNSVERQKWVVSSVVESFLKVACSIQLFNRVSLKCREAEMGVVYCRKKPSILKCFFQGVF